MKRINEIEVIVSDLAATLGTASTSDLLALANGLETIVSDLYAKLDPQNLSDILALANGTETVVSDMYAVFWGKLSKIHSDLAAWEGKSI